MPWATMAALRARLGRPCGLPDCPLAQGRPRGPSGTGAGGVVVASAGPSCPRANSATIFSCDSIQHPSRCFGSILLAEQRPITAVEQRETVGLSAINLSQSMRFTGGQARDLGNSSGIRLTASTGGFRSYIAIANLLIKNKT